jgi:hypothetical protein
MKANPYKILKHLFALSILLFPIVSFSQIDTNDLKDKFPKLLGANNSGMEFLLTFHPARQEGSESSIYLFISSEVQTEVRIYTRDSAGVDHFYKSTTIPNATITIALSPSEAQPYTRTDGIGMRETLLPTQVWQNRAVRVESDAPIIVYGLTRFRATSDGFLALPTGVLGTAYIVSSYRETSIYDQYSLTPYASVIGAFDNTKVSFFVGGNMNTMIKTKDGSHYTPGKKMEATLNKGDVWLIASDEVYSDLGGSLILADKPVAVISGNHCAYVPSQTAACDFLIEQELPMNAWGKKYLVSPIFGRKKSSIIRIFAKEPGTNIQIDGNDYARINSFWGEEGEGWIEIRANKLDNLPTVISSSKSINVVQYNTGQEDDGVTSDPFQLALTPVEQFQNELAFTTPGGSVATEFDKNYINLIYKGPSTGKIPDDLEIGENTGNGNITWQKVKDFDTTLSIAFKDKSLNGTGEQYFNKTLSLPHSGYWRIRSQSSKIAGYVYGFSDWDSYGYPSSLLIHDLEKADLMPPNPIYQLTCEGNSIDSKTYIQDYPTDDSKCSGIASIYFDVAKSSNYKFSVDDFIPGTTKKINFKLEIINPDDDAKAVVNISDRAGNDTTLIIEFKAIRLSITPQNFYFGDLKIGDTVSQIFIIKNESDTQIATLYDIALKSITDQIANYGFKLSIPFDKTIPLFPKEERTIKITFVAKKIGIFVDSIGIDDGCRFKYKAMVYASVEMPIIEVTDANFGKVSIGGSSMPILVKIRNIGSKNLIITGYKNNTLNEFTHNLQPINPNNPLIIPPMDSSSFSVVFTPTQTRYYLDSIVFSTDTESLIDPICVLQGEGIEPKIAIKGDNWGRRRIHLQKYDNYPYYTYSPYPSPNNAITLENTGSVNISISSFELIEDLQSDAFQVFRNGQYYSLKELLKGLDTLLDDSGNLLKDIPVGQSRHLSVIFNPTVEGLHKLHYRIHSSLQTNLEIELLGIGVAPVLTTENIDFGMHYIGSGITYNMLRITNQNSTYADSVKIQDFDILPLGSISNNFANVGSNGFAYDESNMLNSLGEKVNFPIDLRPGEYIDVPVMFKPLIQGEVQSTLETYSDAKMEAISIFKGNGVRNQLDFEQLATPLICFQSDTTFIVRLKNYGNEKVILQGNSYSLTNDLQNYFSIKNIKNYIYQDVDLSQDYELNPNDYLDFFVQYSPRFVNSPIYNQKQTHFVNISIDYKDFENSIKALSDTLSASAIYYARESFSLINNEKDLSIQTNTDTSGNALKYDIYLNQFIPIELLSTKSLTVEFAYHNYFLAVKNISQNQYSIQLGDAMPEDAKISSVIRKRDLVNNIDSFQVVIDFTMPFNISEEIKLLEVEFFSYFPSYREDEANKSTKPNTIEISHNIISNDNCIDYLNPASVQVTRLPICIDTLRQIVISSVDYNLEKIAPNPLSGSNLHIDFSVGLNGYTEIRLISSLGIIQKEIVSSYLKSGKYEINCSVSDLPSGMYILEMRSGEFNAVEKLMLSF